MKMTRREMIQSTAAAALVAALPTVGRTATPVVYAAKGEVIAENVRRALAALGGIEKFVSKGDKVVIKPNMGFATTPLVSATTDPQTVRALVELALNAGAKSVEVIDNPCSDPAGCEKNNGIKQILAGLDDVHFAIIKSESFFAKVAVPEGRQLRRAAVLRSVLDCDALISVPVAKSHGGAQVSFSLKNWMGVVHNRREWHAAFDVHQAIADFATFLKPQIIVLDATRALVTGGPGGPGKVEVLNTIYTATDMVALDSVATGLAAWNGKRYRPDQIKHIRLASEMGVGTIIEQATAV